MSWSFSRQSLVEIHEMAAAIKGSEEVYAQEPFMIFYAEPSSPLKNSEEAVQKLVYCARHRIPQVYTPCPIAGGTAPATMAGLLVQNLAETLAGVVLSQLVREGAPIVVGGVVHPRPPLLPISRKMDNVGGCEFHGLFHKRFPGDPGFSCGR